MENARWKYSNFFKTYSTELYENIKLFRILLGKKKEDEEKVGVGEGGGELMSY